MAALDFGMALSRGLIPKDKLAQEDLLNLAGGRNIFKSEDWWQKQVDKQVKEGYRQPAYTTLFLTKSGQYKPGYATHSGGTSQYWDFQFPDNSLSYVGRDFRDPEGIYKLEGAFGGQYKPALPNSSLDYMRLPSLSPANLAKIDPKTNLPLIKVQTDFSKSKRVAFTAPELKRVEDVSRSATEAIKKESAQLQASSRRLKRATAGLVAKARVEGEAPLTGLPALGEGGLGITGSILGGGIKL